MTRSSQPAVGDSGRDEDSDAVCLFDTDKCCALLSEPTDECSFSAADVNDTSAVELDEAV